MLAGVVLLAGACVVVTPVSAVRVTVAAICSILRAIGLVLAVLIRAVLIRTFVGAIRVVSGVIGAVFTTVVLVAARRTGVILICTFVGARRVGSVVRAVLSTVVLVAARRTGAILICTFVGARRVGGLISAILSALVLRVGSTTLGVAVRLSVILTGIRLTSSTFSVNWGGLILPAIIEGLVRRDGCAVFVAPGFVAQVRTIYRAGVRSRLHDNRERHPQFQEAAHAVHR